MTKISNRFYAIACPDEFMNRMSDYSIDGKQLISFEATFNHSLCVNVIHSLQFGTGLPSRTLPANGSEIQLHRPYAIVSHGGSDIYLFGTIYEDVRQSLSFQWFKTEFICKEHGEFCDDSALQNSQV